MREALNGRARQELKLAVDAARRSEHGLDLPSALEQARQAKLDLLRYQHENQQLRERLERMRKEKERYRARVVWLERKQAAKADDENEGALS